VILSPLMDMLFSFRLIQSYDVYEWRLFKIIAMAFVVSMLILLLVRLNLLFMSVMS